MSQSDVTKVIANICATFDSRRLGLLGYCLGTEATRSDTILILSQSRYASNLLHKFQMDTCKPAPTLLVPRSHLSASSGDLLPDATKYQSMVGGLQYLTLTCPDLAFAVNHVCRFIHQPHTSHL